MVPKCDQDLVRGSLSFCLFFDHTCTFYLGNTYKCQKTVFPTFFNKLKEFIHTCTFYLGNTYKCAMTVFTILMKNNNQIKRKLRTLQGMIFDDFLDLWLPFGTLWFPCGSLLAPFWLPPKILFLFDLGTFKNHPIDCGTLP